MFAVNDVSNNFYAANIRIYFSVANTLTCINCFNMELSLYYRSYVKTCYLSVGVFARYDKLPILHLL